MVDNSALRHGVREAVLQLAAQGPVRLELYDCGITQSMPSSWAGGSEADTYRALLYARRAAELEREALALRARGIAVVTLVEQHTPLEEAVARRIRASAPDLIVKERAGDRDDERSWHVQTDLILTRHARCPVVLVAAGLPYDNDMHAAHAVPGERV